ncbi:MAG TPA: DUF6691 family protein [Methyloceanibacter sp.]|jgi:hypothetical protein|nr:DUF6691 family protein [Methyloceanibacter sp.]
MRQAVNFLAGLIFGLGLLISGMANPAKVQNFLDIAGTFDPSLIFVMAGAVTVSLIGYRFILQRPRPILAERFYLPTAKDIDLRLVGGAALFGIGWGLSGFCPGPAIVSLPLLAKGTLIFVLAMLAGIGLARLARQGKARRTGALPQAE